MPGTDGSTKLENIVKYLLVAVLVAGFGWAAYEVILGFLATMPTASLALSSVLLLLGTLLIFGMAMNAAGLSDKTQALGLPEGSVRAIMALALVGLFAIMASSVLQGQGTDHIERKGLTEAAVSAIKAQHPDAVNFRQEQEAAPKPANQPAQANQQAPAADPAKPGAGNAAPAAAPVFYTVTFDMPKKIDEYAKQVLTVIGTLMTAVVAFYFGSASSRVPTEISRAAPVLGTVINANREPLKDDERLTLDVTGSSLNSIRQVRLSQPGSEFEAESVLSNATNVTATFAANARFKEPSKWTVTVVDDIGRSASKPDGLTFALKSPAPATPPPGAPPTIDKVEPTTAPVAEAKGMVFKITGKGLSGTPVVELIGAPPKKFTMTIVGTPTDTTLNCKFPADAAPSANDEYEVQVTVGGKTAKATTKIKISA